MISASWSKSKPTKFDHTITHTEVELTSIGGGVVFPSYGVALTLVGGLTKVFFHLSPPAVDSLYFCVVGDSIYFNTYKMPLMATHPKAKVEQVRDGVVYVFDGTLKKYKGQSIQLPAISETRRTPTEFLDVLISAADDIYNLLGKPIVSTSISGGTDGILTAIILKEIGATQSCVCVGRNEQDFDPVNARVYADALGLDYEFIQLGTDTNYLQDLLTRTLLTIEQTDFSNVLMGMCNLLVRDNAESKGIYTHFNADLADVVLGNDMLTVGSYLKSRRAIESEATSESWARYRLDSGLHLLPTNIMIAKVFSHGQHKVRQLFYHPQVIKFLLSSPLQWTPASRDKKLYKAVLKSLGPNVPWSFDKKVGFYTGAGIGKLRLENQVLSDENIRSTFNKIKETLK